MLTYAYRIGNDQNWSLSMGLSGGVFYRPIDGSQFEAEVVNDPSINYNTESYIRPDANAGVEFQNTWFIIGLSSTHLFSINKSDDTYLNSNHRYGYFIYKNNNLESFYYKIGVQVVNRSNLTVVEGNVFFRLKHATGLMKGPREILDFGLTIRSSRQMSFLAGILITPDLRLGYAYDHSFIKSYHRSGTHEILLEYRLFNRAASTRYQCGISKPWYQ
jgi:type IX secretion system PorP/SprF family membrane protein